MVLHCGICSPLQARENRNPAQDPPEDGLSRGLFVPQNRQHAGSRIPMGAEGHGGPGGEDRFCRRACVRRCCGIGAAPYQPWDSTWQPRFHLPPSPC